MLLVANLPCYLLLFIYCQEAMALPNERDTMKIKTADEVQVGDKIIYRPFGGTDCQVLVQEIDRDIKNGRAGFAGVTTDGLQVWGYCSQIARYLSHGVSNE